MIDCRMPSIGGVRFIILTIYEGGSIGRCSGQYEAYPIWENRAGGQGTKGL
jgi:hypothetical protein